MRRGTLAIAALAGGLALATAADAQRGGGGGGGFHGPPVGLPSAGAGLGPSVSGAARAGPGADFGVSTRDQARVNSQGSANASATGRANANANSAIASGTNASALADLSTGMTVKDSTGMVIGTVSKVVRSDDGKVRNVLVAPTSGKGHTLRLAPTTLSLSGSTVVTTETPR